MKALLRWQTTLSKHMQALQLLEELPENFFQLSVGLLEKSFSQGPFFFAFLTSS